jgi:hypothetical protein
MKLGDNAVSLTWYSYRRDVLVPDRLFLSTNARARPEARVARCFGNQLLWSHLCNPDCNRLHPGRPQTTSSSAFQIART